MCRGVSPVPGEPCAEFGSRTGLQQPEDVECVFVYDPLEIAATGVIETVSDADLGGSDDDLLGESSRSGVGQLSKNRASASRLRLMVFKYPGVSVQR